MDVGRSRARGSSPTGCGARAPSARSKSTMAGRDDRDVSVFVGRWAWLDVRALVEEHGSGKALLRVSTHLRPTSFGIVSAIGARRRRCSSAPRPASRSAGRSPAPSSPSLDRRADRIRRLAHGADDGDRAARRRAGHDRRRHDRDAVGPGARAADRAVAAAQLRPAQRVHLRRHDPRARRRHVHAARSRDRPGHRRRGRGTPATTARRSRRGSTRRAASPSAPNGDIYFADSNNHVIRRIDARGNIEPVVGNHELGAGFSGDFGPATAAQLDTPDGVAIAPDGDLIVADSHNDRIRRVDRADRRHHDDRRLGRERLRRRRAGRPPRPR